MIEILGPSEHVEKSWGDETVFADVKNYGMEHIEGSPLRGGYCGKLLRIRPGCSTSIHMHRTKDETLLVYDGVVELEFWGGWGSVPGEPLFEPGQLKPHAVHLLGRGCRARIRPETWHRLRAVGMFDALVIEASTDRDEAGTLREKEPGNADQA